MRVSFCPEMLQSPGAMKRPRSTLPRARRSRLKAFPPFMRHPQNAVDTGNVARGLVGYVFEGADGSQVVLWQCADGGVSPMHRHDYDEYAVVLSGTFTGTIGGKKVRMKAGDECFIPAGVPHQMLVPKDLIIQVVKVDTK